MNWPRIGEGSRGAERSEATSGVFSTISGVRYAAVASLQLSSVANSYFSSLRSSLRSSQHCL